MHPLIADKTLVFSPALATAIGLEEAIALTWLNDIALANGGIQWHVNNDQVRQVFPFWDDQKIRLVLRNLHEKGVVQLISPLFPDAPQLVFCFAAVQTNQGHTQQSTQPVQQQTPVEQQSQPQAMAPQQPIKQMMQQPSSHQPSSHQPMQQPWQPTRDGLNRLQQHGLPDTYSLSKVVEVVLPAREHGNNRHYWNTQYIRFIKSS